MANIFLSMEVTNCVLTSLKARLSTRLISANKRHHTMHDLKQEVSGIQASLISADKRYHTISDWGQDSHHEVGPQSNGWGTVARLTACLGVNVICMYCPNSVPCIVGRPLYARTP